MAYLIVIEYVPGAENKIADDLSRLDSIAIDNEVPSYLAKSTPFLPVPYLKLIVSTIEQTGLPRSVQTVLSCL